MRNLSIQECDQVSAGYEAWQVISVSGLSSGLAFGAIEAYSTFSLIEGLKYFAICSVPTMIASSLILGSIAVIQAVQELPTFSSMSHCS